MGDVQESPSHQNNGLENDFDSLNPIEMQSYDQGIDFNDFI